MACAARSRNLLRLRTPITPRIRRRLKVCSVARFSTDEQRRQSILAQHRYNRNALIAAGVTDFDWEEVSDEGVSGEHKDRPGIHRLYQGILGGEWDLIICEDSSRLYRNLSACLDLVGAAVDHKVRVVCIGDDIDTAETDWEDRLTDAQKHHCRDNKFTRYRINRSFEDLWEMGAAVGPLRPGFRRNPTKQATADEPAEGPFYDELIPEWVPVIREAYQRIAGVERIVETKNGPKRVRIGEPPWSVARWLTAKGLPKINGARGPWNERNVISMIKSEINYGEEFHAKTKSVKKHVSGKSQQEAAKDDDVRQREMLHHQIVSDTVWYQANEAIQQRKKGGCKTKGDEHPLAGIPRDSRTALSRILICGAGECSEKMHNTGRNEGGYRCGGCAEGRCWNKATALKDLTHAAIAQAIVTELMPEPAHLQAFIDHTGRLFAGEEYWQAEEDRRAVVVRDLTAKCDRLGEILEDRENPPETLVKKLEERELQLNIAIAELESWQDKRRRRPSAPTGETILQAIDCASRRLLEFGPEVGTLLEHLIVNKIRVVPYQVFGSNKVVLRAEFELALVGILPADLVCYLEGSEDCQPSEWLPVKPVRVNLFKPSLVAENALIAHELVRFLTLEEAGELLEISKRQTHLASQLGKAMHAAGITDPYVRLTESPKAASRWRVHKKFKDPLANEEDGQGLTQQSNASDGEPAA